MRGSSQWPALLAMLIGAPLAAADDPALDLAKIERRIGKEPVYQTKPGYLLLVFGREAKHKVWLVRDGDTLYVDRHATGDLSQPECRVAGETDRHYERLFKAGDLTLGGKRYTDLQVIVYSPKSARSGLDEMMPMFKEFFAAQPEGKFFTVSIDVPFEKPFPDQRVRSPL